MSFKPIDSRRDEFRKYLERSGVVDEFTKVLIKLFNTPERPENAIQFIFENLGHTLLHKDQYEYLKKELEDSRNEVVELKRVIEKLEADKFKFQNDEIIKQTETNDVDWKQEPVNYLESSQDINEAHKLDEKEITSGIQNDIQEETITSSIIEANSESVLDNKKIEDNSSKPVVQEINKKENEKVSSSETVKETPTSTTEETKKSIELEKENSENIVDSSTVNDEVISNLKTASEGADESTKDIAENLIPSKVEENTNEEKPAEDNKNKVSDENK